MSKAQHCKPQTYFISQKLSQFSLKQCDTEFCPILQWSPFYHLSYELICPQTLLPKDLYLIHPCTSFIAGSIERRQSGKRLQESSNFYETEWQVIDQSMTSLGKEALVGRINSQHMCRVLKLRKLSCREARGWAMTQSVPPPCWSESAHVATEWHANRSPLLLTYYDMVYYVCNAYT